MKDVETAVVDSSAMAWITTKGGAEPKEADLNEAMKDLGSKVQKLAKVVRPEKVATYEIAMKGFS